MTAFWGRTGLELSLQVVVFLFCRCTGALHPQSDERVPRGIGRQEALLRGRHRPHRRPHRPGCHPRARAPVNRHFIRVDKGD
jgi:hypothetical protein